MPVLDDGVYGFLKGSKLGSGIEQFSMIVVVFFASPKAKSPPSIKRSRPCQLSIVINNSIDRGARTGDHKIVVNDIVGACPECQLVMCVDTGDEELPVGILSSSWTMYSVPGLNPST